MRGKSSRPTGLLPSQFFFVTVPITVRIVSVQAHLDGATADLVLVHHAHGPLGVPLVDEPHEAGPPLLHLGVLDFAAVAENENAKPSLKCLVTPNPLF